MMANIYRALLREIGPTTSRSAISASRSRRCASSDRDAHQLARALAGMGFRLAVIGAGWSGLAAALEALALGAEVTLFEMAPAAGGAPATSTRAATMASTTASTSASAPTARRCA
jgi:heterodisulfide reductase subunit A-like polyferredoxin